MFLHGRRALRKHHSGPSGRGTAPTFRSRPRRRICEDRRFTARLSTSGTHHQVGGYLRADVTFDGGHHGPGTAISVRIPLADYSLPAPAGADGRYPTATEYGVVRTFGQGDFQFETSTTDAEPDDAARHR